MQRVSMKDQVAGSEARCERQLERRHRSRALPIARAQCLRESGGPAQARSRVVTSAFAGMTAIGNGAIQAHVSFILRLMSAIS